MPNAILATFLNPFSDVAAVDFLLQVLKINQYFAACYIGFGMAHKVGFNAFCSMCVGAACMLGSGA